MRRLLQFLGGLGPSARFHLLMAGAAVFASSLFIGACLGGSIRVAGFPTELGGIALIACMLVPLPAYWQQKGNIEKRDAALTIVWALLLSLLLPLPFLVVGRLHLPLQDASLAAFDHMVGFSTPAVMAWASHSRIGVALNFSYMLLQPFMVLAVLVPALAGKPEAKVFLLANLVGLVIAGSLFMFLPAVGPWFPHRWVADALQQECERDLMHLRAPAVYLYSFSIQEAGIVCFPSCHVFWAVISASAVWGIRWMRIPVALLCAMIILSTLTTGWHYLADVLAGLALSAGSIVAARRLAR